MTPGLTLPPWVLQHLFWILIYGYVALTAINHMPPADIPWTRQVAKVYLVNVLSSLAARATQAFPRLSPSLQESQKQLQVTAAAAVSAITEPK